MRFTTADIQRVVTRTRRIWQELDHAQRRSFEVRTGIPAPTPRRSTGERV